MSPTNPGYDVLHSGSVGGNGHRHSVGPWLHRHHDDGDRAAERHPAQCIYRSQVFSPDTSVFAEIGPVDATGTSFLAIQQSSASAPPVTVTFRTSDPSVATLVTSTGKRQDLIATIQPGSSSTPSPVSIGGVALHPLKSGTTAITASASGLIRSACIAIRDCTTPAISLGIARSLVGAGLQQGYSYDLGVTNHGGVTLRIESSAPAVAVLASNPNAAGSSFIDISVPNGTANATFYIQGITPGSSTISASAPNFTAFSGTATVVQPAIQVVNVPATTTTLSPDSTVFARVGVSSTGSTSLTEQQVVHPGAPVQVQISTSLPRVAQIVQGGVAASLQTVTIDPGSSLTPNVGVRPVGVGTTSISASAAGFLDRGATGSFTVNGPSITVGAGSVGAGLQNRFSAVLGATNHGGVTVRISSSNTAVALISPDGAAPGSAFIDVVVPNGSQSVPFNVQGVGNGAATITVNTPRFSDGTATFTVSPPVLRFTIGFPTLYVQSPDQPFGVSIGVNGETVRPGNSMRSRSVRPTPPSHAWSEAPRLRPVPQPLPCCPGQNSTPGTVAPVVSHLTRLPAAKLRFPPRQQVWRRFRRT